MRCLSRIQEELICCTDIVRSLAVVEVLEWRYGGTDVGIIKEKT